jgi:ubiquinone/menaquinone biosynthesis C-methylase UbiE
MHRPNLTSSARPDVGPVSADQLARDVESAYFDQTIAQEGDFNPFTDRGWETIARRFREMVPLSGPLRLLDVGCGTGQSRRLYIDRCRQYCGIDLSSAALGKATQRFPDSAWIRSDATRLPFADGQFDVVAFSSVLHHIGDFGVPLREALRVLRAGGYAFAFDPNLLHPAMALFRHPGSLTYLPDGVSPNERPLAPRELHKGFQSAGFQAIRQRCQADIPYRVVAPKPLNALLGVHNACDRLIEYCGLGRWLGPFVITAGRKAA